MPSLTRSVTLFVPTRELSGVPDNTPVVGLKFSHAGKVGALKVSTSVVFASVAVKVYEYSASSLTISVGVEVITGGTGLPPATGKAATTMVKLCCTFAVPSLRFRVTALGPTSPLPGVPDSTKLLVSRFNQAGSVGADMVSVSDGSMSETKILYVYPEPSSADSDGVESNPGGTFCGVIVTVTVPVDDTIPSLTV